MININNLDVCSPDGRTLLKGLSFRLSEREKLAFLGPNGCGKSTLLRYISGLEGEISLLKRDISFTKIVYLPTRPLDLLLPWYSVEQNKKFFVGSTNNLDINEKENNLYIYSSMLGYDIEKFSTREVYKLSSGQQAILAICCALIQRPDLLVADEIFATLTEDLRSCVAQHLKNLNLAVICATHDSRFVDFLGAKVIHLDSYITHDFVAG